MNTHIKHYPAPPRQKYDRNAKIAILIYGGSTVIMLAIIAFGIYSYLTK